MRHGLFFSAAVFLCFTLGTLAPRSAAAAPSETPHQHEHNTQKQMDHGSHGDHGAHGDHGGHGDHGDATDEETRNAGAIKIRGARVYREICIACHGENGDGTGDYSRNLQVAPPDFTHAKAVVDYPKERIMNAAAGGHQVDVSSIWKDPLSEEDQVAVAAYIQEAFMLAAATSDASAGRRIFARTCSVCHGDRGNGASWAQGSLNPPPFDFTSYKAKKMSRRHMINTVTYGRDNTAMVGWATQMSKDEIAAVVDYIRETFIFPDELKNSSNQEQMAGLNPKDGNRGDHAGHGAQAGGEHEGHVHGELADMSKSLPNGLVGDPGIGKKLYDENCAPCHGKSGAGDGPRAYFIFPRPENFTGKRSRAELNLPHLYSGISDGVVGTVMPSWRTVLNDQQIAHVAKYVFDEFIQAGTPEATPQKLMKPGSETMNHGAHGDHGGHDQHPPESSKKN